MNSKVETESDTRGASRAGTPDVSVLVPILNEARFIGETLPAMLDQHFEGQIEFLLLDGGSDDGTPEILAEWAVSDTRIRVLDNPGRRQSNALNIGLTEARGRYLVRMDAHTFYPHDYVRIGVGRLMQGDVAWVAGPQLAFGVDGWSRRIALALNSPLGIGGAHFRLAVKEEFEADTGFTGVLRTDALRQLGGWNEGWLTNEDGELAARVRKAGGRIVCVPGMAAKCITRSSLRGVARQYWRYGIGRAQTCRRHTRSLRRSHLIPPALVVVAIAALFAPGPAGWVCRGGIAIYVLALVAEASRMSSAASIRDAAWLPAIFATMHLCWGAGFIWGALRPRIHRGSKRAAASK